MLGVPGNEKRKKGYTHPNPCMKRAGYPTAIHQLHCVVSTQWLKTILPKFGSLANGAKTKIPRVRLLNFEAQQAEPWETQTPQIAPNLRNSRCRLLKLGLQLAQLLRSLAAK